MQSAAYWIDVLKLKPHPEGGYYSQVYKSSDELPEGILNNRYPSKRQVSSSIYFLLTAQEKSRLHRIKSDELWHFYTGSSLTIYMLNESGERSEFCLGPSFETGECFQQGVPAGVWFGASINTNNGFALVGCTVAPAFDFEDFELAKQEDLLKQYPQHEAFIKGLT